MEETIDLTLNLISKLFPRLTNVNGKSYETLTPEIFLVIIIKKFVIEVKRKSVTEYMSDVNH